MTNSLPRPPEHPRSLVYFGSPETAVPALLGLVDAGFEIPLVISMPDRRRSRRAAPTATPVKEVATQLGIPVSDDVADALSVDADCGVVVAYGRLIDKTVLAQLPMINLHFSLLPRWRGAAPVERAILAGDRATGVCVMGLEPELDTGPVYRRREAEIGEQTTAQELSEELAKLGAEELVAAIREGLKDPVPQIGTATTANKIHRSDLNLDWKLSAVELDRVVRVGGAWTTNESSLLKIHQTRVVSGEGEPGVLDHDLVGTSNDLLQLLIVQPEGKSRMDASAWINGAHLGIKARLGT
ncbi:MAG: methionyl-tRNA formyltransferase [Acidimicrobiales bacterium]|nr:methionyl-tRNA formyltransferase [Acidimicrobiales bacterium]MDP6901682.1 methionyl-tRNA formyltransferase [Acidimicrobiales bacterium]HJL98153.1 methionyl-tRNA formyltransferase [Acidimicrobiales bacterium]